jgi:hypothetical protein
VLAPSTSVLAPSIWVLAPSQDAKQVELEPIVFKVVSYKRSCALLGPWALRREDSDAYIAETGIFLGDCS